MGSSNNGVYLRRFLCGKHILNYNEPSNLRVFCNKKWHTSMYFLVLGIGFNVVICTCLLIFRCASFWIVLRTFRESTDILGQFWSRQFASLAWALSLGDNGSQGVAVQFICTYYGFIWFQCGKANEMLIQTCLIKPHELILPWSTY